MDEYDQGVRLFYEYKLFEAIPYFEQALLCGIPEAALKLAFCHSAHVDPSKYNYYVAVIKGHFDEWNEYFFTKCNRNIAEYDLHYGCFLILCDKRNAFQYLLDAAQKGHKLAQYLVGQAYEDGIQVKQDYEMANHWMNLSAKQYWPSAQYRLGIYYHIGKGVDRNLSQAFNWFKLAASQNHSKAQYRVGELYILYHQALFDNLPERNEIAELWLKKSAAANNSFALSTLGEMALDDGKIRKACDLLQEAVYYSDENGHAYFYFAACLEYEKEYDHKKIFSLIKTACEYQYSKSFHKLATYYRNGFGCKQDLPKAIEICYQTPQRATLHLADKIKDDLFNTVTETPSTIQSWWKTK